MAKATAIISAFHNLPIGELVDQLGGVKAEIADLETRQKGLRDELLRRGVPQAEGASFGATITRSIRWTLDTKALKAEMGGDWYDRHCRQSSVTTVNVEPLIAVAARDVKLAA